MTVMDRVFRGPSLDEALDSACRELDVRLGELAYEIVSDDVEGVAIDARVDAQAVVGLFLSEVFRAGELDLSVDLEATGDVLEGEISGEDRWILTRGNGRGLDALQYLCNRVLRRKSHEREAIHLDVDGYKDRRSEELHDTAERAADEAVRTRRPVTLGPLTPAARREIHLALADDPGVETMSDGNGFLKKVVVRPLRR